MAIQIAKPMLGELPNLAAPGRTGLIGEWWLNEKAGPTANDLSGKGNDGTIISAGGDITWIPGGVHFAGTDNNDQIDCGNKASLQAGEITFVARVRFTDLTNNDYMIGCKGDAADGWYLEVNGGALNRLVARYNWSGGSNWLAGGNDTIAANTWYNIAMSQGGGFCRIYLNGALYASTSISGTMDNPGAMALYLGRYVVSENFELVGDMEFASLHSRVLTAGENAQIHINSKRFLGYTQEEDIINMGSYEPVVAGNPWWYYELMRKVG